jgi:short-subunit dehydrogenase
VTLDGALAVVTGASSGIGEATARALAARGSHVVLLARNLDRLNAVAGDIRSQGNKAEAYPVDMADAKAVSSVAQRLTNLHGSPHIVINNAGVGRWLSILETGAEEAAQMMAVPYLAAFNITRELLPGMLARRSGHIFNVTSVAARLAWPGAVAYTAARAAMEGFTNALRADLHGTGLGVTLAMFGTVETPYWDHNPGSRARLPKRAAWMPALSPQTVASKIVSAIENGSRSVVAPAMFRLIFLINRLFPAQTEAALAEAS